MNKNNLDKINKFIKIFQKKNNTVIKIRFINLISLSKL